MGLLGIFWNPQWLAEIGLNANTAKYSTNALYENAREDGFAVSSVSHDLRGHLKRVHLKDNHLYVGPVVTLQLRSIA